jgi:hypothetical protein
MIKETLKPPNREADYILINFQIVVNRKFQSLGFVKYIRRYLGSLLTSGSDWSF